jgi:subtilase family serine protease
MQMSGGDAVFQPRPLHFPAIAERGAGPGTFSGCSLLQYRRKTLIIKNARYKLYIYDRVHLRLEDDPVNSLKRRGYLIFAFGLLGLTASVCAQPSGRPVRTIRGPIDETSLVTLAGNTRPEANAQNDRGIVSDDFPLEHMLLQLKRSPEREAAMAQYVDDLHNSQSPNFHKWLTPEQFAEHFGVAQEDVDTVTNWLKSHGFTVHGAPTSGLTIDFGGTAGQVRSAYHTEIHALEVNGAKHFANMGDPQIPSALEPVVSGIVSLHNFHPKPMLVPRGQYTYTYDSSTYHALVPGDIATIYNLNPLFAAGLSGKGQTIMVLEDTYLYSTGDWTVFRKTFGLARTYPSGTLNQVSPTGAITCTNPGFQGSSSDPGYGDDGEAAIDVEWASAAAPNAAIVLAACTDTTTNFGGYIALQNVLNGPAAGLPSVVSISYGEAEAEDGATFNAYINSLYQQAVSEGVSIFVSSGDEDAASADDGSVSTHGIGVSGWTSTPYNVSVGGLDFGYTADAVNPLTYWSATNSSTYSSALSYIQEVPWNDSCAGGLIAGFLGTTPLALCNNSAVTSSSGDLHFLQNTVGGSGGPSGCATGTPASSGKVGGTCAGYAKPGYQAGLLGNPSDGVRDIPDISLFASNGFWDAYYVTCWSNPNTSSAVGGGFTCTGAPSAWAGFGGTSVSSPILAGIQALVNQHTGSRWGNPNTQYYALAKNEYATAGTAAACNSNTVNKTSNSCIFYDITQGDNDAVCKSRSGYTNCYRTTTTYGVLSTSNSADDPAYLTNVGWDFPTGIGSVNAYNLVMGWSIAP